MTYDQFKVGMKVKQKVDEGDGMKWTYGKISEVREKSIMIDWDDLWLSGDPLEHFEDEFDSIKESTR